MATGHKGGNVCFVIWATCPFLVFTNLYTTQPFVSENHEFLVGIVRNNLSGSVRRHNQTPEEQHA